MESYENPSYQTAFSGDLATLAIRERFNVTVSVDGDTLRVPMVSGTVEDALERAGITLEEDDFTIPAAGTLIMGGDAVTVHRVEYRETVTEEVVPHKTQTVYTSVYLRHKNQVTVMQEGRDGLRAITTRERWVDGELENTEVVADELLAAPVDQIEKRYGERAPVSPRVGPDGTTNKPTSYKKVLTGKAAGYYSKTGGKGASGLGLGYGTVAVNPRIIPYGTLMYIESTDGRFVYGYAIATDTGTAVMRGDIIADLYYETYQESCYNELPTVNIYIIG